MTTPKIGFLCGSLRKNSINKALEKSLIKRFKAAGAKTSTINLEAYNLPLYHGDLDCPAGVKKLIRKMKSYDGIIVISPEYNGGLPPVLKNAIDWTSTVSSDQFTGPVFAIASCSPGPMSGIMVMRQINYILMRVGAEVIPTQVGCGTASAAFDSKGCLIAEPASTFADKMQDQLLARIAQKT